MWYDIVSAIHTVVKNDTAVKAAVAETSITIGMPSPPPPPDAYPVIWIVRGDLERAEQRVIPLSIIETTWTVELCIAVRDDGITPGYSTLSSLESSVFKALFKTPNLGNASKFTGLRLRGMASDRDTFRPFLGNWWVIEVDYRWSIT